MDADDGLDGLAQNETKHASYHNIEFNKICLGMTWNDVTNWILINYNATSLYNVIADGSFRMTTVGRAEWMSLINGALLQDHCNEEGFNVKVSGDNLKFRIGIAGNTEEDCGTYACDSAIGFGFSAARKWSSGHFHVKAHTTFGYTLVQ